MIKAFKYRLYPTKEQEFFLAEWQGPLRFVWNQFLNLNIQKYESEKKFVFKYEMANSLPILKKQYPWISAPGQSLQKISLSVRTYICPVCGLTIDRDYNAALNIKAYGLARLVEQGRIKILETNTAGIAGIYACGNTSSGDLVYAKSSYVLKNRRSETSSEKQEAPSFRSE